MTDRELLELAAKASGIEWGHYSSGYGKGLNIKPKGMSIEYYWNPLTDDGDALCLAVKLQMVVGIYPTKTNVTADGVFLEEFHGNNSSSATRRAIVRAAVEIGRGMK
jgi:hypothetical protein